MSTDYEQSLGRLRAAIEAGPTPGEWHWDSEPMKGDPLGRVRFRVTTLGKTITRIYHSSFDGGPTNAGQDAAYIAAANPDTISKLIAERDAQDRTIDFLTERLLERDEHIAQLKAELDLRRKSGSASERLHNLCEGIAAEADGSEWSREEWERIDAENAALRKERDALKADAERGGWIDTDEWMPEPGQLIAKRWERTGQVWAGVYSGSAKDSSFDQWLPLAAMKPQGSE